MKPTDSENDLALLFKRRSIRAFTDQKVDNDRIRTLLEAAMAAPSAVARDPWRFIVVREKATLSRLAEGLPNGRMLAKAALGIIVCGDSSAAHDGLEGYMIQDCIAALENMLLAATATGLGAVWLGVYPRRERQAHLRSVLGIPESVTPVAATAIGYPAEEKSPRTRYQDSYVHRERW